VLNIMPNKAARRGLNAAEKAAICSEVTKKSGKDDSFAPRYCDFMSDPLQPDVVVKEAPAEQQFTEALCEVDTFSEFISCKVQLLRNMATDLKKDTDASVRQAASKKPVKQQLRKGEGAACKHGSKSHETQQVPGATNSSAGHCASQ
jgi:hypothetical protein